MNVSTVAAVVGAVGSIGLMLKVGHRNDSLLLLALFGIWILSPFVVLLWIRTAALRSVTVVIALASLAIYGWVAFGPPIDKPAGPFLMVPLVSWLIIAAVVLLNRSRT